MRMELDDLKTRWEEQNRKMEAGLRLNSRLLKQAVLGRAETSLRRLSRLLVFELIANGVAVLWLGSFLADHANEPRFALPAAGLLAGCAVLLVAGIRQIAAVSSVDYAAPIVAIQRRLESLRVERIRAAKWTLMLAPLAWTPLLIVAMES